MALGVFEGPTAVPEDQFLTFRADLGGDVGSPARIHR